MTTVKKSILTAVCIALCVALPQAFHAIPNAGNVWSPLHLPVLLCGLLCGWPYGLLCGLGGVTLSSLITGMPPAPVVPGMLVECAVYGFTTGLMMQLVRTKHLAADLYISLAAAMLLGRLAAGAAKALIFARGTITLTSWAVGYFVTGLPAILLQLALLPVLVFALMKANLIPARYPKER